MTDKQYEIGNPVVSKCKCSMDKSGTIWKVTENAVHVVFDGGTFQKFHFSPTHHSQTPIDKLELQNRTNPQ